MRHAALRLSSLIVAGVLAGCGGSSTGPSGGGNGGGVGGGVDGGGTPPAGAVTVGNDFFSAGGAAPAVTTVPAGTTVTWTWTNTGGVSHSVQSVGTPSFASSGIKAGEGSTYQVTFTTPGTYRYDCAVHGTAMSGTVVVQ